MWLEKADVDRYGPLVDCRPPFGDGLTVLSGPNEAGKTLYLEALLQLLDSGTEGSMDPSPRVGETPQGRVEITTGGDVHVLSDGTELSDVSSIEPRHLPTIFVVRDNDLELPGEQDYYTSLIERLGDIHTSEINEIQSKIKDRGRLTSSTLNISGSRQYNDAKNVHRDAEGLAEEIHEYVQKAEQEELDELERRRLRHEEKLRETREEVDEQEKAEKVDRYERLSGRLDTYRSRSERIDELDEFDNKTLERLKELEQKVTQRKDSLSGAEEEIGETKEAVENLNAELEKHKEKRSRLESRKGAVETAKSELKEYRGKEDGIKGVERRLDLTKKASVGGLVGGGVAAGAGALASQAAAIGIGVVLLVVAAVAGFLYRNTNQRLSEIESADKKVLRKARNAGFDVDSVEEVAAKVSEYEKDLEQAGKKVAETKGELSSKEEELEKLKSSRDKLNAEITESREELDERIEEVGVESTDEYKKRVKEKQSLISERKEVQQSLLDSLGEPNSEDPEQRVEFWEQQLESIVEDIGTSEIDAETYDEGRLETAREEVERLTNELEELEKGLREHNEKIEEFERRTGEINTEPFVGTNVRLGSRTTEGLKNLAGELEEVVEQIEGDAEISRKAHDIFERIGEREEQKLTELFDPDGPASATFERLTDGNYTEVAYDAGSHDIVVRRNDGRELRPRELSQGTKDQLYFASRVSLAQQLLGSEPGFFLLDDPFIAADSERLDNGFQTLSDLEDEGWQILYLTSKEEVYDGMVNEYGIDHIELAEYSQ